MNFVNVVATVFYGVIIAVISSAEGGNVTDAVQVFQNGTDEEIRRNSVFNRIDEENRQGKHYGEILPCYDNYEKHIPRQRPCGYGPIQMKSIPVYQPMKYVYQYPIYQYPVYKYPTMAPLPVFKPVPYVFPTLAPTKSLPMPQYKPFVFPSLKPLSVKSIPFPEFKPLVRPALKPLPTFAPMKSLPMPTFKPFVFPSLKPLPVKSFQFMPLVNPTFAPLKTYAPWKSLPVAKWPSLPTSGHKSSGLNFALVKPNEHLSLSLPHKSGSTQIDNVANTHNAINITIAVVKNCSTTIKENKCNLSKVKDFSKQPKDKKFDEIIKLLLGKNKPVVSKGDDEELFNIVELLLNEDEKADKFLTIASGPAAATGDEQKAIPSLLELLSLVQSSDDIGFKQIEYDPTQVQETRSNFTSDPSTNLSLNEFDEDVVSLLTLEDNNDNRADTEYDSRTHNLTQNDARNPKLIFFPGQN